MKTTKKILKNGNIVWYRDKVPHRTDGPTIVYPDGTQIWCQNGKKHRIDGPAVILDDGTEIWFKNGKHHRDDGPAQIYADGAQQWFKNGKIHRKDGPAAIHKNHHYWYLDDKWYDSDYPKQFQRDANLSDEDMLVLKLKYNLGS